MGLTFYETLALERCRHEHERDPTDEADTPVGSLEAVVRGIGHDMAACTVITSLLSRCFSFNPRKPWENRRKHRWM